MKSGEKTKPIYRQIFAIVDSLFFSLLIILPIRAYFRIPINSIGFVLIGAGTVGTVMLLRIRSRTVKRRREAFQIRKQNALDKVLLTDDRTLSERLGRQRFILIRKARPDRFDILEAIRTNPDAVGLFDTDREILGLIETYAPQTIVYRADDLIRALSPDLSDTADRKGIRFKAFDRLHLNKYLVLGILLFIASLFVKSKIYFRLVSCICLILAPVFGIFRNQKPWKNFLIFLDKKGD